MGRSKMTDRAITRNTGVSVAVLISVVTAAVWITVLIKDLESSIASIGITLVNYHKRLDKTEGKIDSHVYNHSRSN